MAKVSFTDLPKYDYALIRDLMKKHSTLDPEKALQEECIPFKLIPSSEFSGTGRMSSICVFTVEKSLYKHLYLDGDELAIFTSDNRSSCVCQ